jgi:dephospho-CoA kinase
MLTIGLIGGVASGKSEVARMLAAHGATILDADKVGHDVLRDPEVIQILLQRWGPSILNAQGEINRSAVAAIVFAPGREADRQFLNEVSHPRIAARLAEQLQARRAAKCPVAILDAALLLEAGWDSLCDEIVFVDVPREARLDRARARGWDDAELSRRERTQLPLAEKRARATIRLDNSGSKEKLAGDVASLWERWTSSADQD